MEPLDLERECACHRAHHLSADGDGKRVLHCGVFDQGRSPHIDTLVDGEGERCPESVLLERGKGS